MKEKDLIRVAKARAKDIIGDKEIIPCIDHENFNDGFMEVGDKVFFWFDYLERKKRKTTLIKFDSDYLRDGLSVDDHQRNPLFDLDYMQNQTMNIAENIDNNTKREYDISAICFAGFVICLVIALVRHFLLTVF